jgi:hypothetical protein
MSLIKIREARLGHLHILTASSDTASASLVLPWRIGYFDSFNATGFSQFYLCDVSILYRPWWFHHEFLSLSLTHSSRTASNATFQHRPATLEGILQSI